MTTAIRGGTGNFAAAPGRASEAGSKGGAVSGGNFKNCPERAREAGRKGGLISRRGPTRKFNQALHLRVRSVYSGALNQQLTLSGNP